MQAEGIILGYDDGTFRPQNEVERFENEFLELLISVVGNKGASKTNINNISEGITNEISHCKFDIRVDCKDISIFPIILTAISIFLLLTNHLFEMVVVLGIAGIALIMGIIIKIFIVKNSEITFNEDSIYIER